MCVRWINTAARSVKAPIRYGSPFRPSPRSIWPRGLIKVNPVKFTLSNAQQQDLLIRGQPLLIALPLDRAAIADETDAEAMQHARESIVLPPGVIIASAEVDEVTVAAPSKTAWPPESLSHWVGSIVPCGKPSRAWLLTRHVVVLAIVRGLAERHPLKPPAWPGGKLQLPEHH